MTPPSNSGPSAPSAGSAQSAGFCAACGAQLATGARFCHRCGTPFGQGVPATRAAAANNVAYILPWGVAFVALLALVANFAGKNFGSAKGSAVDGSANSLPTAAIDGQAAGAAPAAPFAGGAGGGQAPDLSKMTPAEIATRLYNRVMTLVEAGQIDSATFIGTRMALPAHEMLEKPTIDDRYHHGRIAEVTANAAIAKAQADTMLAESQSNLLGLILAQRAARMMNDLPAERTYSKLLLQVADKELKIPNPDYDLHRAEIERAIAEAKAQK